MGDRSRQTSEPRLLSWRFTMPWILTVPCTLATESTGLLWHLGQGMKGTWHWSSRRSFKKNHISINLWKLLKNAWHLPSSMHSPTFWIFFLLWGPLLQMTEINTDPIPQGSDSKRVIQTSSSGRGLWVHNYFHNITKTCFAFVSGLTFALAVLRCSVVSDSLQPHGLQPAGLLYLWGFSRQEYWSGLPCPPPEWCKGDEGRKLLVP